ncbi:MAG: EpsG family protein [Lachnospiraceae bacterium]|nr:EpsG family protein [Lachnospiraceae bacterium]
MGYVNLLSALLYIGISILTMALAYRVKALRTNTCEVGSRRGFTNRLYLIGIFIILFMVSALRFDVGNDYEQYTKTAHEAFVGGYVVTEPGFNRLVRFVYTILGGEYYEVIFGIFAFVTIALFLKALYEQSEDFFMSFSLFMLLGIYFQTFNTVRYYFALALVLYGMRYVTGVNTRRDFVKYILLMIIGAFFHKSVLITIPVFWLAGLAWKKWHIIVGILLSIACYLLKDVLLQIALILYPSYRNTSFLEGSSISYMSVARCMAVLGLYVWYIYHDKSAEDEELRFYAQLNLLAMVVSVFFTFLPVVTRIAYYFSVSQLLMIPMIVSRISKERDRKLMRVLVYLACAAYFVFFLVDADKDGVKLIPYDTWIFSSERYLYK